MLLHACTRTDSDAGIGLSVAILTPLDLLGLLGVPARHEHHPPPPPPGRGGGGGHRLLQTGGSFCHVRCMNEAVTPFQMACRPVCQHSCNMMHAGHPACRTIGRQLTENGCMLTYHNSRNGTAMVANAPCETCAWHRESEERLRKITCTDIGIMPLLCMVGLACWGCR